jgi:ElaB/YqjD/DUF883 family membrane-anchored ribosome-binding protein
MDYDRERQQSGTDADRTDAAGTPRAPHTPGTTGSPGTGDLGAPGTARVPGTTPGLSGTPGTADTGEMSGISRATGDVGTRAGSYDRKFAGEDEASSVKHRVADKLEEGKEAVGERLGGAVDTGRNRIADQLERVGERIDERARTMDEAGGVQRRAGALAHRTSDALDHSAEYIRTHEPAEMRDDLEQAIRERPLMSVTVALGAGFLLARILRD